MELMSASISCIPCEVLCMIFNYLPHRIPAANTCRQWRSIIHSPDMYIFRQVDLMALPKYPGEETIKDYYLYGHRLVWWALSNGCPDITIYSELKVRMYHKYGTNDTCTMIGEMIKSRAWDDIVEVIASPEYKWDYPLGRCYEKAAEMNDTEAIERISKLFTLYDGHVVAGAIRGGHEALVFKHLHGFRKLVCSDVYSCIEYNQLNLLKQLFPAILSKKLKKHRSKVKFFKISSIAYAAEHGRIEIFRWLREQCPEIKARKILRNVYYEEGIGSRDVASILNLLLDEVQSPVVLTTGVYDESLLRVMLERKVTTTRCIYCNNLELLKQFPVDRIDVIRAIFEGNIDVLKWCEEFDDISNEISSVLNMPLIYDDFTPEFFEFMLDRCQMVSSSIVENAAKYGTPRYLNILLRRGLVPYWPEGTNARYKLWKSKHRL